MLFSCLLLPRVPINNPSRSETARLLLGEPIFAGFFFLFLFIFFLLLLKGLFPEGSAPCQHLASLGAAPWQIALSPSMRPELPVRFWGSLVVGSTAPHQPRLWGTAALSGFPDSC